MRRWVWNGLCEVIIHKQYSNLFIKKNLSQVDPKDQALATNIFYGTLQNYMYCEYVWSRFAQKKPNKKIQILLSMSVYQILFLDKVPSYAIIDESVSLLKKISPKSAGFVNAILRKVEKEKIVLPQDELEATSIQYSCPLWLVKMWKTQYGDLYKDFVQNTCATLPVFVRRNTLKIREDYFKSNPEIKAYKDPLYIYTGNDISNNALYQQGFMSVQDEGSFLITQFLEVEKGMNVLDTCAAPGTKTFAIAEQMENNGEIVAIDIHEHRCELIRQDAKRLGINIVEVVNLDSTNLEGLEEFDRVLCDVPCSGYGVLSRKPDIKLRMDSNDMDTLIPLQQKILQSASQHVKPGGKLVYSTCTMNKKENEKQVEKFLKANPNFVLEEEKSVYPNQSQEGFYMARIKKVNS